MQSAGITQDRYGQLSDKFRTVRKHTEYLCEPLAVEDYIPQPVVDVSPARWNIAHTTWFFEEMILKHHAENYQIFDADFGYLFNSYYNTIGDRTPRDNRGAMTRPTVDEVFAYRRYVDEKMLELLSQPRAIATDLADLVTLGLNHEQQHQELLLSDLKYTFGYNPLFPAYREGYFPEEQTADGGDGFIGIEGGIYEIGHQGDGFCFDNELSRHKVYLNDYEIAQRPVTNAEFLEFIADGAYRDHRLWHAEGWDWVNANAINAPLHWHERDGAWQQFTLGGLRPIVPDAPVCHVSFYEASAFAEWKGCRLPTEFEWEAANTQFNWGKRWEWSNSAYLPYPGFAKAAGAVGEYNGKFMVNQMVLRGASIATPEGHSRPTYRNFFHPHLRWQFTGVRLAR
jgi:ergothioneine biosynthesis protein EgtB